MTKSLQRIGKSLLMPVSIMPAAAILMGIGHWIDPLGKGAHNAFAAILIESGGIIIDSLPFLFAIAIAVGMAKEKDNMIVVSTIVSYMIVTGILSPRSVSLLFKLPLEQVPLAFQHSANAFVGILIGGINVYIYNKFSHVRLPVALSFFNGKRLVPIISSVVMLGFSIMLLFVWPILFEKSVTFGKIISGLGPLGAGLYGFFNRILIPTGLHHALNAVFWFDVAGINDIGKFWGTVPGGIEGVTGIYQAGFFPIMMFGLPAAALAIYHSASPEKKGKVRAILISAAFASFFTGVTEPLEFSFMLFAPGLYFLHAVLTGVSMFIAASFHWIAGFSFSAGFVDFVLSIKMPFSNQIFMLIILGIVFLVIYYFVFRYLIVKYNLMTLGRGNDELDAESNNEELNLHLNCNDYDGIAILFIESLGGKDNIVYVESCVTRLRVELKDMSLLQEKQILSTGASGIVKIGKNNLQIIIGAEVEFIAEIMNLIIK